MSKRTFVNLLCLLFVVAICVIVGYFISTFNKFNNETVFAGIDELENKTFLNEQCTVEFEKGACKILTQKTRTNYKIEKISENMIVLKCDETGGLEYIAVLSQNKLFYTKVGYLYEKCES